MSDLSGKTRGEAIEIASSLIQKFKLTPSEIDWFGVGTNPELTEFDPVYPIPEDAQLSVAR